MPKVSIIVPAIYRPDLTQVCINSIISYTTDYELILVQEGEDLELKRIMTAYKAKYIQNREPKGYSGALNTGLKEATGDYICFMNNDTVAVPGWMDEMLKCYEENENTGLVCPTFWGSGGKQSVDWGNEPRFDYVDNIFGIIGVCFVIPRKVLGKIGIWDEGYGHGGEDFDICYRIQQAGYDLFVARRSFIYHYGGASTRIKIGNDIEKTTKNQIDKLNIFSKKHNIPMENIMDKINLNNNKV